MSRPIRQHTVRSLGPKSAKSAKSKKFHRILSYPFQLNPDPVSRYCGFSMWELAWWKDWLFCGLVVLAAYTTYILADLDSLTSKIVLLCAFLCPTYVMRLAIEFLINKMRKQRINSIIEHQRSKYLRNALKAPSQYRVQYQEQDGSVRDYFACVTQGVVYSSSGEGSYFKALCKPDAYHYKFYLSRALLYSWPANELIEFEDEFPAYHYR